MATSLMDSVLSELRKRKGTYPQIARDMQPDNPSGYYSWLTKFATGQFPDPGIRRIEALAEYFRKQAKAEKRAAA